MPGLKSFLLELKAAGFNAQELAQMASGNAAELLDDSQARGGPR
ncbi:MAG: hypothetical protein QGG36_24670 [Pirellulaceae bacterium]|jgi:hypothetical protein|nr:hypothetical protein [Pirellulaceae bacterium]